ncbi:MAG: ABC transporter permease [Rhodospirillaceae bacterium]|nr:ABC transporter permease [Rhodospirillaceae bacterium]
MARPYLLLSPAILSLALLMVAPVVFVLIYSFWLRTAEGLDVPAFQFGNWVNFFTDGFYWRALASTFKTALITTVICILLGYPTAYFLARAQIRNRGLLLFLMFLPFWVSYIIRTMSWINVLGKNGFVNAVLVGSGLIDEPMKLLYNDFSVIMGLVYFMLPYMIINVYVSLDGIDRNLESAARVLGCTPWQSFREVTLPLSLPGLGAGSLLCFVLAAGSYVTPRLLGGTDTLFFPDLIYEAIISQLDWPFGAVLSIVMLLALGLVIAVYNRFMNLSDVYRSFAR